MARFSPFLLLLSLAACGGGGDSTVDAAIDAPSIDATHDAVVADVPGDAPADAPRPDMTTCSTDADGDGHVTQACGGDDCDDADPHRYPTNPEVCDAAGHDEDCNPATLGPDADGDTFVATTCCNAQPTGEPLCGTDCDDTRATVNPTAAETCNGVDDNCNGMTDEGVINTYGADCDDDGYGSVVGTMTGCMAPTAAPTCASGTHPWVTVGGDCDDTRAAVHPGVPEVCNGYDDDCNGTADDPATVDPLCNVHGTGATCVAGACTAATCTGGYLDCTSAPGCETDPTSDPTGCGGCGHACAHATCVASVCVDDFVELGAGNDMTCGRRRSGVVACWGWNGNGQLGDGTTIDHHTPMPVTGITDAVQLVVGQFNHACALHADGTVSCWGGNTWGYLGGGTTTASSVPVTVTGLANATAVAASSEHTCAIHDGGRVSCWGSNASSQLGDGTLTDSAVPVAVAGVTDAVAVGAGGNYTCAIRAGNVVWCWGRGNEGEMGNGATGATAGSTVPVAVAGGVLIAPALVTGFGHVCAHDATNVACWGGDSNGQLGDGMMGTNRGTPMLVTGAGLGSPLTMAAGKFYTCLLHGAGGLTCWGANDYGQLGDGTMTGRTVPTPVFGVGTFVAITAGVRHTCALRSTGEVDCWGANSNGQLGDGTTTLHASPMPITDP